MSNRPTVLEYMSALVMLLLILCAVKYLWSDSSPVVCNPVIVEKNFTNTVLLNSSCPESFEKEYDSCVVGSMENVKVYEEHIAGLERDRANLRYEVEQCYRDISTWKERC